MRRTNLSATIPRRFPCKEELRDIREREQLNRKRDHVGETLQSKILTLDFFRQMKKEELFYYVADTELTIGKAKITNRVNIFRANLRKAQRIYHDE